MNPKVSEAAHAVAAVHISPAALPTSSCVSRICWSRKEALVAKKRRAEREPAARRVVREEDIRAVAEQQPGEARSQHHHC